MMSSYIDKAFNTHYREKHNDQQPRMSLSVVLRCRNLKDRKIKEARMICQHNPTINKRKELNDAKQFLLNNTE